MAKDYKEQTNRSRTKGGKYEKKKKNMEIERSFNGTRQYNSSEKNFRKVQRRLENHRVDPEQPGAKQY